MTFPIHASEHIPKNSMMAVTPELFRAAMSEAMKGCIGLGAIRLHVLDMQNIAVVNTNGYRNRKKRRIQKKFKKRYGFTWKQVRVIKKDTILDIGGVYYGHAQEINSLKQQISKQKPSSVFVDNLSF